MLKEAQKQQQQQQLDDGNFRQQNVFWPREQQMK